MEIIIFLLIAYVMGAIPVGFLIARVCGISDIRLHGSGNIGATNVARILGKPFFFLILFLDAFKAYITLWILYNYYVFSEVVFLLLAALLLFGNGCSIFLKGSGGKGGSTAVGIFLFLHPLLVFLLFSFWMSLLYIAGTVGIASVGTTLLLPVCVWFFSFNDMYLLFSCIVSIWIIWLHRRNIQSMLGTKII